MNSYLKIRIAAVSIIFYLILILSVLSVSADTTAEIKLEVEQTGSTITVNINITENPGIAGLMFHLIYDKTVLELISASDNVFPSPVINDLEEGYLGYSFAEVQDYTETGTILSVKFQILDSEKLQDSELCLEDLDACNADIETVFVNKTDGTVGELLLSEGSFSDSGRKWMLVAGVILAGTVIAGSVSRLFWKKRKNR